MSVALEQSNVQLGLIGTLVYSERVNLINVKIVVVRPYIWVLTLLH